MTIDCLLKMDNPIQPYVWGSRTAIAELMGQPTPTNEPQAEIWMGAHPKAPSRVWYEGRWQPLDQLIRQYPQGLLGDKVASRFDDTLPYLFKVLAVAQPLSIQAHPDKKQASEGFHRENLLGIALDAPNRNYKDSQHKPECICALTTFWGACGFRTLAEMVSLLGPVWPLSYNSILTTLSQSFNPRGLGDLFEHLMHMEDKERHLLVKAIVEKSQKLFDKNDAYAWVVKLNDKYPGDIGVISPLLLNIIQLAPGEALFLPARQLHAYLDGLGIELMANSDNVLRGGLTPKHVDVEELMAILDFSPHKPAKLNQPMVGEHETFYASQTEEFILSVLAITPDRPYQSNAQIDGPEILLCVDGSAVIKTDNANDAISIAQGRSVFVPAAVKGYRVQGSAKLFRAAVNL